MEPTSLEDMMRKELCHIAGELKKINDGIMEMTKERDQLQSRFEALRKYIKATYNKGKEIPAYEDATPKDVLEGIDDSLLARLPDMVQHAALLLSERHPEDMYYKDLSYELQKKGVEIPGENPDANLLAHINRFPWLIKRTSRGRYRIVPVEEREIPYHLTRR